MNEKRLQTILAILCAIVIVVAGVALWRSGAWRLFQDRAALQAVLSNLGAWGPVAIVVAQVLQVLIAPIPGQVVGLVAGYAYGVLWGTAICMGGLVLGTAIAVWLARRLGRPLVERYASQDLLGRVDGYMQRRGGMALFMIFLLPFLPDDVACLVAGLTSLRISKILVLALIGRAPGVLVSCWLGARAQALTWSELGLVVGAGIVLTVIYARHQQRLEQVSFRFFERLGVGR